MISKWVWSIIFLIILILGGIFLIEPNIIEITSSPAKISPGNLDRQVSFQKSNTITVILVGDIMLARGVEYMMKKYDDWRWPFLKIAYDLKGANLLFGNLEGSISDKGEKVGSIYSFRANPKAIEGLKFAGFDILSLANNHTFDYGRDALEDALKRLKEAGINYVGIGFDEKEAYSPIIEEVKGTKIGFLAYTNLGSPYWAATENSSGIVWVDWTDMEKIKEDIEKAKSEADILIVSLHSGEEYSFEPTKFQISFAKAAIEAGADLVFGHHPHIIQRNEKYKNGWIFYSLGNFVFDQGFSEETRRGQILEVLIENGKIKEVIPKEVKINNLFQPEILK